MEIMTGPGQGGHLPGPTPMDDVEISWGDLIHEPRPDEAATEIVKAMDPARLQAVVDESFAIQKELTANTTEARFFTEPPETDGEPDHGDEPLFAGATTTISQPAEAPARAYPLRLLLIDVTTEWLLPLFAMTVIGLAVGVAIGLLPMTRQIIASMNHIQHIMLMVLGVVSLALLTLSLMICWRQTRWTPTID